jgi:hypothetical protein
LHTLKHIIIYILLAAVLCQSLNRVFIVINYYTNTASFAKNCVNKAMPMMHCNGKCQMMKKLQQEDKKDNKDPLRKAENRDEVISSKSFFPRLAIPTSINFYNNCYPVH